MRISIHKSAGQPDRRHERGSAVLVVIAITAILLIYIGGNIRTLHLLKRDLQQVEQKQIRRVSHLPPLVSGAGTNAASAATNTTQALAGRLRSAG